MSHPICAPCRNTFVCQHIWLGPLGRECCIGNGKGKQDGGLNPELDNIGAEETSLGGPMSTLAMILALYTVSVADMDQ